MTSRARELVYVLVLVVFAVCVTWDVATAWTRREVERTQRVVESALRREQVADATLLECQLVLAQAELYWRKAGRAK